MGGFLSLDDLKIKVVKKFRNRIEEHRIIFDAYIYFKKKEKKCLFDVKRDQIEIHPFASIYRRNLLRDTLFGGHLLTANNFVEMLVEIHVEGWTVLYRWAPFRKNRGNRASREVNVDFHQHRPVNKAFVRKFYRAGPLFRPPVFVGRIYLPDNSIFPAVESNDGHRYVDRRWKPASPRRHRPQCDSISKFTAG